MNSIVSNGSVSNRVSHISNRVSEMPLKILIIGGLWIVDDLVRCGCVNTNKRSTEMACTIHVYTMIMPNFRQTQQET